MLHTLNIAKLQESFQFASRLSTRFAERIPECRFSPHISLFRDTRNHCVVTEVGVHVCS